MAEAADVGAAPPRGGALRLAPRSLLPVWSPAAAVRAVRAAVVLGGLFAFTDQVIGNLQMATFAAFGSFATLVLASFSGTRRDRLVAHTCLALAGSALVAIGTAANSPAALAAAVTLPVVFIVFFAGIIGPNVASGATGALLAYVLPAASPGTVAMIPDRLAGWWLASVAGTVAVLLTTPRRPEDDALRGAVRKLTDALAEEVDAALAGDGVEPTGAAALAAKHDLLNRFTAAPYRPLGLGAPDQALANTVELLEWCTSVLADAIRERGDLHGIDPVDAELLAQSASALRASGALLAGGGPYPELEQLERTREASLAALGTEGDGAGFRAQAQVAFHAQTVAIATLAIGAEVLVAARAVSPADVDEERRRYVGALGAAGADSAGLASLGSVARRHASLRSVWFVNSARAAVALAAAVAVADLSSVQHGFWVVLGTLSVLRTNAAATGATALRALAGTAVGFVIGGALLLVIGSDPSALWAILPVAVFVAAYSPGTAPFAVGQAAFTVVVAILFNLLVPVGWKVGVVRIEDVAIGCGVSVLVGLLLWPRGVSSVVGDDLADAYRTGASFLTEAVRWTSGMGAEPPGGAQPALTTALRLDAALRGFLAEQGSKRIEKTQLWRLVGGSLRLRLTAQSVSGLPREDVASASAREALHLRTAKLTAWYDELAVVVGRPMGGAPPTLSAPQFGPEETVRADVGSRYAVWLCEHLDHLAEHLGELIVPAQQIAALRRRPWWR